jgi:hypothetical protein
LPKLPICTAAMLLLSSQSIAAGPEMASRPVVPSRQPDPAGADTCGQLAARRHLGSELTPQLRALIVRTIGHDRIRIVRPGAVLTQDLRADRLNLITDDAGKLLATRCG